MSDKVLQELGVQVNLATDHLTPERTTTFYNPKMSKNRMLVLCALSAALRERSGKAEKRMKCLDAFAATGLMGLQWKVHHHGNIALTMSDTNPASVENIKRNCTLNGIAIQEQRKPKQDPRQRLDSEREKHAAEGVEVETAEDCEDKNGTAYLNDCTPHQSNESIQCERTRTETAERVENIGLDSMDHNQMPKIVLDDDEKRGDICSQKKIMKEPSHKSSLSEKLKTATVLCCDANLVMRQRFFDYIHLDPYGCATPFMDSAFCNVSNHGIVSITSTDTAALYGKCPQVTQRNYGAQIAKCKYLKELAARIVIAAAARAAARCNKGLEVLLCVALEHFVLVIMRVRRGAGQADRSIGQIKHVLHCQLCSQRTFAPNTLSVPGSLYQYLDCSCHQNAPGKTAVMLGPAWSGSIYNADFVCGMEQAGRGLKLGKKDLQLLNALHAEAVCSGDPTPTCNPAEATKNVIQTEESESSAEAKLIGGKDQTITGQKRTSPDVDARRTQTQSKKRKRDVHLITQPAFYFSIPQHSIKDMDSPRVNQVIHSLQERGFRASRTHFDPEGVRTDAGLAEFKAVLRDTSTPTKKL